MAKGYFEEVKGSGASFRHEPGARVVAMRIHPSCIAWLHKSVPETKMLGGQKGGQLRVKAVKTYELPIC